MSKLRQVEPNLWEGPKDKGITPQLRYTERATEYYQDGAGVLHEPLHKDQKKPLIARSEETEDLGEVFEHASAGGHEGYLDMRVNSVTDRAEVFYMFFIIGPLAWLTFQWIVLSNIEDDTTRMVSIYSGYGVFFTIAFWYLFHTLALPVRFHKANQEVYVYHREVLYRIPWSECEMSVQFAPKNQGYRGLRDGYQLTLWLNPQHATNPDKLMSQQHVPLNMLHNMEHHIPMYAYWEYVRRYMNREEPLYIKMDTRPRHPGFAWELGEKEGYIKILLIFIFAAPFVFLLKVNQFALLSPFKEKWPEEVHEWTGEKCDWH